MNKQISTFVDRRTWRSEEADRRMPKRSATSWFQVKSREGNHMRKLSNGVDPISASGPSQGRRALKNKSCDVDYITHSLSLSSAQP